jgi:hypothetical protein
MPDCCGPEALNRVAPQATLLVESIPEGAEFVSPARERWVSKQGITFEVSILFFTCVKTPAIDKLSLAAERCVN